MLKAYHIIGPSSVADVARIADSHHQSRIIQELLDKHSAIMYSGALRPAQEQEYSRQFALDRLVVDDQYVFLSIGKRYWHTPDEANFGFIFDAEQLLQEHGAILRDGDLMQDYEGLLDEIVSEYTTVRDPSLWTEEEKAALFEALDNPDEHPDYKSPDEDYHNLVDAIQKGDVSVPHTSEATEQFVRRARHLQSQRQYTGQQAVQRAQQSGNSGHYELLVRDQLYIPLAKGYIMYGEESLKYADEVERTITEYTQEYGLNRYVLTNAIRDKMKLGESWGLQARSAGSIRMIKQGDFDAWYLRYLQNRQKRDNRTLEKGDKSRNI